MIRRGQPDWGAKLPDARQQGERKEIPASYGCCHCYSYGAI